MELYGQEKAPLVNMDNLAGFPIAIFGGKEDLLASPGDYSRLMRQLCSTNSCLYYREVGLGHLGFLVPANDLEFIPEMIELVARHTPGFQNNASEKINDMVTAGLESAKELTKTHQK